MALEYFPFYYSYRKKLAKLSDQEVGRLVRSLLEYGETGETEELAGRESVAFDFIADDIDRAKEAYNDRCAKNKKNIGERYERIQSNTTVYETEQTKTKEENKKETKNMLSNDSRLNARVTVAAYLDKVNPSASQTSIEELVQFAESMGNEVCLRAIDIALDNKKTSWNYIRAILRTWKSAGVKCLADIETLDKKPERSSGKVFCADYSAKDVKDKMAKDMLAMERVMNGGV